MSDAHIANAQAIEPERWLAEVDIAASTVNSAKHISMPFDNGTFGADHERAR